MIKSELDNVMALVIKEIQYLRSAGQKEYAGGENAFGNFERLSDQLQLNRKKVLWVYLMKHIDGVVSYLNGHISQREPVERRINDIIVYLILLRGMIQEDQQKSNVPGGVIMPITILNNKLDGSS